MRFTEQGFSKSDQVVLLTALAEEITNRHTLDRVSSALIELGLVDAEIGALAPNIAEVDECDFCGEYAVIQGEMDENGLKYCSTQCRDEE